MLIHVLVLILGEAAQSKAEVKLVRKLGESWMPLVKGFANQMTRLLHSYLLLHQFLLQLLGSSCFRQCLCLWTVNIFELEWK